MLNKKYSAFVSSNFESLRNERNTVINSLLDAHMIPICMEHFIATTGENFNYIKKLIDQSDIFIMLLGDIYGSCDSNGVSWTENEYKYAAAMDKICYVLKTEQYNKMKKRLEMGESLTEDEQKQLKLGEKISFAQIVNEERPIPRIIHQIIASGSYDSCVGWIRRSSSLDIEWQNKNRYLNLDGKWYHVHLKDGDSTYIRIGSVTIEQRFDPEHFCYLKLKANNYNVQRVNSDSKTIVPNRLKKTVWTGDYFIRENEKMITGVYRAERQFRGNYGSWNVEKGIYRGVHILDIVDEDMDGDTTDVTVMLSGTFNDVYPSPKAGNIYLFRSANDRFDFLYNNFEDVLRSIK